MEMEDVPTMKKTIKESRGGEKDKRLIKENIILRTPIPIFLFEALYKTLSCESTPCSCLAKSPFYRTLWESNYIICSRPQKECDTIGLKSEKIFGPKTVLRPLNHSSFW